MSDENKKYCPCGKPVKDCRGWYRYGSWVCPLRRYEPAP